MTNYAGRFVLTTGTMEEHNFYVTSWDTWEECEVAFENGRLPRPFFLFDGETGREWIPGSPYEWEAART